MPFSSDEEDEEVLDKPTDEEMDNDQDPLDFPSEESSSDEDEKDADPEWKTTSIGCFKFIFVNNSETVTLVIINVNMV